MVDLILARETLAAGPTWRILGIPKVPVHLRRCALGLVTVASFAPFAEPVAAGPEQDRLDRRIVNARLIIDTLIDGARDTTIGRPQLLTVSDSLVVYYDYSESRLSAVDTRGNYKWRAGRRGQGPGEWGNPTALVGDLDGAVVVNDGANSRIVRIDANGKLASSVRRIVPLQRLGRLPNGQFVAFGGARGRPSAELLDRSFNRVRTIPWSGWPDSATGLVSQLRVASGPAGVVAVSIFTGRIFPLRADYRLDYGVGGVDERPLPTPVPIRDSDGSVVPSIPEGARPAIRDAAIVGQRLFVLANSQGASGRLLDIYDLPRVTYRGSIRVPLELNVLAGGPTWLAATSNDPYPTIVRLRWHERELNAALAANAAR